MRRNLPLINPHSTTITTYLTKLRGWRRVCSACLAEHPPSVYAQLNDRLRREAKGQTSLILLLILQSPFITIFTLQIAITMITLSIPDPITYPCSLRIYTIKEPLSLM